MRPESIIENIRNSVRGFKERVGRVISDLPYPGKVNQIIRFFEAGSLPPGVDPRKPIPEFLLEGLHIQITCPEVELLMLNSQY